MAKSKGPQQKKPTTSKNTDYKAVGNKAAGKLAGKFEDKGDRKPAEKRVGKFEGKFEGKGDRKPAEKRAGKFEGKFEGKGDRKPVEKRAGKFDSKFEGKGDRKPAEKRVGASAPNYTTALKPKKRQAKPVPKQEHDSDQVRLNKAISDAGVSSRREADQIIAAGLVRVNGQVAVMGQYVRSTDLIEVEGKRLKGEPPKVYIALNKPSGIECTTDTSVAHNIIDFVGHKHRIFPIGRLDKASEGLILMTNNGDIVNKVLRAGNDHQKEYVVTVDKPITAGFVQKMSSGVAILDTVTKPCKVTQEGKYQFRIILTQGLNRQIRRMCESLGYEVVKLVRVRIMHISLGDLALGKWRNLSPIEVKKLMAAVEKSTNEQSASFR